MIKLTPITKQQFDMAQMRESITSAIASIPSPSNGRDGAKGASGKDGKDGVTTTVVKEVLANKEKLLSKKEFEEFKAMMQRMESDIRQSLAGTHGYFPGGGTVNNHDLPWHVISKETIDDREQAAIHGELVLEGDIILEGSAQLVIEN